ncbi:MAG: secretin N-terminal domain-containing protein [Candidatus Competibacteraceae bacterium]|jgi:hypothetical protein|nr:secretin N-terminal domain-containing protein [Candidatus Competibacteraceae bacterium]
MLSLSSYWLRLWLIGLSFIALPTWANSLEIIELRHRSAEEIIPMLRPVLQGQGVVTGRGSQLIVRTTPRLLEQIQAVVNQLDTPRHSLLISVRQLGQTERDRSAGEWSGAVDLGSHGRVEIGRGVPGQGVQLGIDSDHRRRNERIAQQVQVLDGGEAYIQVGAQVPRQERYTVRDGAGRREYSTTYYQPLTSGFYVRPRLHGNRVTLEVSPNRQREGFGGQIETHSMYTTVTGRLGEWLEIGASNEQSSARTRALTDYSNASRQEQRRIQLKVELLH